MKVIGMMTRDMVEDTNDFQMVTFIKATTNMERLMVKDSLLGLMEKSMMENGLMESKKATEFGKELKENLTLDSGKIVKQMVMEFTNGKMEINMKGNGEPA